MICEGAVDVLRLDVVHIVAWQPVGAASMLVFVGYDRTITLGILEFRGRGGR
jgi:hypothetical protein